MYLDMDLRCMFQSLYHWIHPVHSHAKCYRLQQMVQVNHNYDIGSARPLHSLKNRNPNCPTLPNLHQLLTYITNIKSSIIKVTLVRCIYFFIEISAFNKWYLQIYHGSALENKQPILRQLSLDKEILHFQEACNPLTVI